MATFAVRFDRGTLCIDGDGEACCRLPGVLWDDRTCSWRAPAYLASRILAAIERGGGSVKGNPPWPSADSTEHSRRTELPLRDYQARALRSWGAFGSRGIVCLPTGAGKTRVAQVAMARVRAPVAVLCPTRALVQQWEVRLREAYGRHVGVVGDGRRTIDTVTIFTFESAYRHMDVLGDRFALLVVDEAHHFASGARQEALETCAAPMRLGLTATPPPAGSAAAARLEALIGPVVCEVAIGDLVGDALADFDVLRLSTRLSEDERHAYEEAYAPFAEMRRALARAHPDADWNALVEALSRSAAGRAALRGFYRAVAIASMPQGKMRLVSQLLADHRSDKSLVFCATVDQACAVARRDLVPAITAETRRSERERVLARFREGALRAIVSARVLNEGVDVPDANVAILAAGALGVRELVQRVGRVLRAAPGKRAVVYELTTAGTIDDRRAEARRRMLAAGCPAFA